ncbi:MAG TPA: OsmC family protein [Candidatus Deferrimicrobiaceae bacterium]|nr:OsmC family protein [Candidatus Deferrimicrobiaceae bacterium]
MSDAYRVELLTVDGGPTAVISAGASTVLADRPVATGGRGLGFNGGQLMYASIAACVSNDLYREAATLGIILRRVALMVDGDFPARGQGSTPVTVEVDIDGEAPVERLRELVALVAEIAEIPNSMRGSTLIEIRARNVMATGGEEAR